MMWGPPSQEWLWGGQDANGQKSPNHNHQSVATVCFRNSMQRNSDKPRSPEASSPPQAYALYLMDSNTEAAPDPDSVTRGKLWGTETFLTNLRQVFLFIMC